MAAVFHPRMTPLRSPATPHRIGAIVVVAMHFAIVAGLLNYAPARNALFAAAPIMVEFITPPKVEKKPDPPAQPPKPKPVAKRIEQRVELPPILTAPAEAPSPVVAPPPPVLPVPAPALAPPAPPAPAAPLPVSQPIFNADYLDNPAPAYPLRARRNGEQGRVILRVLVSASGTADDVQVRTSSGFVRLDESARDTVRRWKFVPAKRGTEAVPAWVLIPISFRLED